MTPSRTATVVMDDLWGGPPRRLGTAPSEPVEAAAPQKRRKVHSTQRECHARVLAHADTLDGRCLEEIRRQGAHGATRQEIAATCDIAINSVCGAVDRLMKGDLIIEPITGHDATGKPEHFRRQRCKVLVHHTYQNAVDWRAPGQPVRTSAA